MLTPRFVRRPLDPLVVRTQKKTAPKERVAFASVSRRDVHRAAKEKELQWKIPECLSNYRNPSGKIFDLHRRAQTIQYVRPVQISGRFRELVAALDLEEKTAAQQDLS